jgi:hypothetical protein
VSEQFCSHIGAVSIGIAMINRSIANESSDEKWLCVALTNSRPDTCVILHLGVRLWS